jgi:hypothetical protein
VAVSRCYLHPPLLLLTFLEAGGRISRTTHLPKRCRSDCTQIRAVSPFNFVTNAATVWHTAKVMNYASATQNVVGDFPFERTASLPMPSEEGLQYRLSMASNTSLPSPQRSDRDPRRISTRRRICPTSRILWRSCSAIQTLGSALSGQSSAKPRQSRHRSQGFTLQLVSSGAVIETEFGHVCISSKAIWRN